MAFLGLCFGSFVNALVWRLYNKKDWVKARSQCPKCGHKLDTLDLIPVLSWLALRGRCRYCKKPISPQYPIVELVMGAVFILSYVFWPYSLSGGQLVLLVAWLACSVGLMALLVYDIKWMLLPSTILYPVLIIAVAGKLVYLLGFENHKLHAAAMWALSILVASGIFWLLYQGGERFNKELIGYGDVRLGWITGTLLQGPLKSLLMIFIASLIGNLVILPLIAAGKRRLSAKIPYGPFLITATFICILFGDSIINWYDRVFLP